MMDQDALVRPLNLGNPGEFTILELATGRLLIRWERGRGSNMAPFSFVVISQIMVLR